MNRKISVAAAMAAMFMLIGNDALAQQYVYPAKGQSADQQKKDESECYTWAVQRTGFDPARPTSTGTATGTTPGAGARGAVRGAVVGEIVADDAGAGAAAGAVAGRSQSRRQNANAQQQQQANFANARAACLEGRGYSVK